MVFSKKMMGRALALGLAACMSLSGMVTYASQTATTQINSTLPKYVFYFIGDGLGSAQRQVAEFYLQHQTNDPTATLTMNEFPVMGMNTTYSADTLITDSAAAGTALATGHKTNNGVIAQLPDGTPVKTLVELAEEKGMATGIISTTRLTHATPAAFASHNENRNNENEIAVDFLDSGVDFMAGGGYRHFIPQKNDIGKSKRKDDTNVIEQFSNQGYQVFVSEEDTDEFMNYEPKAGEKVFAAFTYSHLPYEIDRMQDNATPSLAQITEKGIDALSTNDSFLMVVEGGRIDHAGHANDVAGSIYDTLAFDAAIAKAYDFYMNHPNETLIMVAGDHETGGLGLGFGLQYFMNLEEIDATQASIEDKLAYSYNAGDDRAAFLSRLVKEYGLTKMTEDEMSRINEALDMVDNGLEGSTEEYGYNTAHPYVAVVAHILSERAGIEWTTYAHSGTIIPFTAIGVGAEDFMGYLDNTDIAEIMADQINVELDQ